MTDQTQTTTENKAPSHYVYYTVKGKNGDEWNSVGAAWPNKDGKGYNLKIQDGMITMHLVMREPKPRS